MPPGPRAVLAALDLDERSDRVRAVGKQKEGVRRDEPEHEQGEGGEHEPRRNEASPGTPRRLRGQRSERVRPPSTGMTAPVT